jgi:hypothetical protein
MIPQQDAPIRLSFIVSASFDEPPTSESVIWYAEQIQATLNGADCAKAQDYQVVPLHEQEAQKALIDDIRRRLSNSQVCDEFQPCPGVQVQHAWTCARCEHSKTAHEDRALWRRTVEALSSSSGSSEKPPGEPAATTIERERALVERVPVLIRVLRMIADREAPPDAAAAELGAAFEDVPEVTWAELGEMSKLMREAADTLEALSPPADRSAYRSYVEANRSLIESPEEIARFRERAEAMHAWNVIRLLDSHEALRAEFATWHRALRSGAPSPEHTCHGMNPPFPGPCHACEVERPASSETQEERSDVMRLARQMFSDGVDVARTYGDNAFHLWGKEIERHFQNAWKRVKSGEWTVQSSPSQPAETPTVVFERTSHPGMDDPEPDYFAETPEERKIGESMGLSGYLQVRPREGQ